MQETPVPSQIITAVKETVDTAFQQGLVGVFLIFMFAVAIIAITALIYVLRRPAKSTSEDDVNLALSSLADKQAARAEKKEEQLQEQARQHQAEMKEQAKEHALEMKAMGEQFLAAMQEMNNTNNTIATSNQTHVTEISGLKTAVEQMATVGSLPLQDVQKTVHSIETKVKDMATVRDEDHKLKADILSELKDLAVTVRRVDEKLKTKEIIRVPTPPVTNTATVIVPEQELKVETSGVKQAAPPVTAPKTLPVEGVVSGTVTLTEKTPQ